METKIANSAPAPTPLKPARGFVLIVDDEEQNRLLLRDPLEARGYEIAEAENGEQALEQVAERLPDVILLDVMMPRMDGFEVCRRLKNDPNTAPIPVLVVTALSERKERMIGIAAGANDFLNKPVDLQDLTLRVRNALYTKHLFDQLKAEQDTSERLLLNMLPKAIARRMKAGEATIADQHPDVTVLVTDLVGFSTLSAHIGAQQVVCLLNEIFSAFDIMVQKHGLETIKTLGDAYMAAGGITNPRPDHAEAMAELASDLGAEIARLNCEYSTSLRVRIGISTGPVVAGVIGRKKLAYDLWGDTVNLACHLGAVGAPGRITVSQVTYERLQHRYCFQRRETFDIRGRARVTAYELEARL
ncbi:MAG: adenylate/guanylate cyclase domain-containing protein [Verrucomicrobiota bacterium]